jgi:hypothetical protein
MVLILTCNSYTDIITQYNNIYDKYNLINTNNNIIKDDLNITEIDNLIKNINNSNINTLKKNKTKDNEKVYCSLDLINLINLKFSTYGYCHLPHDTMTAFDPNVLFFTLQKQTHCYNIKKFPKGHIYTDFIEIFKEDSKCRSHLISKFVERWTVKSRDIKILINI